MPDPRTLNELFFGAMDRFGQRPVIMRVKREGAWVDLSYRDVLDQVQGLSLGLKSLGVQPADRVAILSENRPEWAIADYACLAARATDVPVYPTLPSKQIEYILKDSGAVAILVSGQSQLDKILEIRDGVPGLRQVIVFDKEARGSGVLPLEDLINKGRAIATRDTGWRAEALRSTPDDLATLIYTSGTTGDPKGVMLTHGNITSNVVCGLQVLPVTETDECLSFLPLSHIFERMAGHYIMMHAGAIINYAVSIDTVSNDIADRQPTVVLSVPRLYEKIYARVLEGALSGSGVKKRIFFWAKRTGELRAEYVLAKRPVPGPLAFKHNLADRLVFSKIRTRTGGRLRYFVSGGAPLSPEIAKFFFAAGLPILEGYGLTETSPVITVNSFEHLKIGTVGRAIPGVEVKIAPDGEVLSRGPHIMKGYYRKPDATAEAIDADGWFHTGDIGVIDTDGFLRITDRKKDIIVTAGGKNIAPQPIENRVKTSKYVSNAVMLGDKRKFPIILVVPNIENLRAWAVQRGLKFTDDKSLIALSESVDKVEQEVKKTLRDLAHFEMPKKVMLVARDFTIESGELTPTLKVKRRVVERNYQTQIEALYNDKSVTGEY
ncbi:MAG TPA: long-chain fatty acid--CoA ligase [Gemmatimonadales bacterium]|jgi:long-chain acyl-CoA synthetase|nr:long-chain fatty acid--CoA ligase [Gemmatimonadales bacterium]